MAISVVGPSWLYQTGPPKVVWFYCMIMVGGPIHRWSDIPNNVYKYLALVSNTVSYGKRGLPQQC